MMPELPARLAALAERVFARRAILTHAEELAPKLRLLRIEGPELEGLEFRAGQEIEVRVSDRAFRHYTPSYFDPRRGVLELLIYLHGNGPGSAWAEGIGAGAEVNVLGPGGRFGIDDHLGSHVFLGDESTIGLFRAMTAAIRPAARALGAIEVCRELFEAPDLTFGPADKLLRNGAARGQILTEWVVPRIEHLSRPVTVYAAGHAGTVRALKRALQDAHIRFRSRIYWDESKRGL